MDIRCFFCLPLTAKLVNEIGSWIDKNRSSRSLSGMKWVSRQNLHLTLKFCGEIPQTTLNEIKSSVKAALVSEFNTPLDLSIQELGTFGRPTRVLFAQISGQIDVLERLNSVIENTCHDAGLPLERRRFTPHLTIARLSAGRNFSLGALPQWSLNGSKWTADKVIFMQSRLTPYGAKYSPIDVIELKKDA